ncbi:MAG: Fe2+-dependent dioxygenase [Burkholderiaceae bacterium]|nr:Fe2+-dependent dioxygenase [Burkholderiaceae bacterium]
MLLHLPGVLHPSEVAQAQALLAQAHWQDGRVSAGEQAAQAKNNQQLPENAAPAPALRQMLLQALERSAVFFSATLPHSIAPPMFNRYGGATNAFGNHVDSAVRYLPGGQKRVRTDLSCTLFLSSPSDYDGGELVIEDPFAPQRIKLAAGDMVVYPGTSVHRVEPVTRGQRLASFFWIQSMVRSQEQRRLLFDMDQHLMQLRTELGEQHPAAIGLTGTYHNLLRLWADV